MIWQLNDCPTSTASTIFGWLHLCKAKALTLLLLSFRGNELLEAYHKVNIGKVLNQGTWFFTSHHLQHLFTFYSINYFYRNVGNFHLGEWEGTDIERTARDWCQWTLCSGCEVSVISFTLFSESYVEGIKQTKFSWSLEIRCLGKTSHRISALKSPLFFLNNMLIYNFSVYYSHICSLIEMKVYVEL